MLTRQLPIPPLIQRGKAMPDERVMFCVRVEADLAEKIRDASYWDRVNINDLFLDAIQKRVKAKRYKARPDSAKRLRRGGRKAKQ